MTCKYVWKLNNTLYTNVYKSTVKWTQTPRTTSIHRLNEQMAPSRLREIAARGRSWKHYEIGRKSGPRVDCMGSGHNWKGSKERIVEKRTVEKRGTPVLTYINTMLLPVYTIPMHTNFHVFCSKLSLFVDIHQAPILRPSCFPEKCVNQNWYFHKK
jgi:hypothetical protein